jgi:hypothetical protein
LQQILAYFPNSSTFLKKFFNILEILQHFIREILQYFEIL